MCGTTRKKCRRFRLSADPDLGHRVRVHLWKDIYWHSSNGGHPCSTAMRVEKGDKERDGGDGPVVLDIRLPHSSLPPHRVQTSGHYPRQLNGSHLGLLDAEKVDPLHCKIRLVMPQWSSDELEVTCIPVTFLLPDR